MTDSPDGTLICGTVIQSVGPLAKWPGENPRLPWHVDLSGYRGGLSADVLRAAFAEAWSWWAEHVEIRPEVAETAAAALVRKHFARIDGPSGTLAWSYLADDTNSPKEQRYDSGDNWVVADRPQGNVIDLVRVACHEIGHVLGLDHDSPNADALMRPSYSLAIRKPTARDVQRMVGLGYRKRTTPVPPPPTPPPPGPGLPPVVPAPGDIQIDIGRKLVHVPRGWNVAFTGRGD